MTPAEFEVAVSAVSGVIHYAADKAPQVTDWTVADRARTRLWRHACHAFTSPVFGGLDGEFGWLVNNVWESFRLDAPGLVELAVSECARHNAHPCADGCDHTDPDIELYVDASAVAGTVA